MSTVTAVVAAGVVGAVARFVVEVGLERRRPAEPWGVFAVNIAGSAVLGLLVGLGATGRVSTTTLLVAGTGFCGAFTTFSAFSLTAIRMASVDRRRALLTVAGMVLACGAAAAAGTVLSGVR
jgi:CrcB protein